MRDLLSGKGKVVKTSFVYFKNSSVRSVLRLHIYSGAPFLTNPGISAGGTELKVIYVFKIQCTLKAYNTCFMKNPLFSQHEKVNDSLR